MSSPAVAKAPPHAGFAPSGYGEQIRSLETVSEIQAFIMRERPGINKGYAERSAKKLKLIREDDGKFYEALRILGIYSDPTARDAIMPREGGA